ncbi:MAG: radical SAM protein [Hormoscilla sp. GM7CHS1pb]|nr:radical SAM protein [Hormoscilla sp. GM7CHS1pb]
MNDKENLYPLPNQVCGYGNYAEFSSARKESGQWVFWEDRVELILEGRYEEVKPLHVELSPTYLCNFACPWCSCRTAREDWSYEDVFNHPHATESTVMSEKKLHQILDNLAAYKIGIQWVGGEPTMHPLLYPAVIRANELGLKQCLFTNGSLLNTDKLEILLDAEIVFIRVSLDAVTKSVHQIHHGYRPELNYVERVLSNLRELARRKSEINTSTIVGVSVVVDERNLHDLVPTALFIRQLCEEYGSGAVDYAIFRPTYQFYNAQVELKPDTQTKFATLVETSSEIYKLLTEVGINVVVPEASLQATDFSSDNGGEACLSCGWFGEVTANGDLVVCSDRYGNPDYFIGNLAENTIDNIWISEQRKQVLNLAEQTSCFKTFCPRNGRGFHLNNVFHKIEKYRREGKIHKVRQWIKDLKKTLPYPEHSFFL